MSAAGPEVLEVRSAGELKDFLDLPRRLYRGDPLYVPPHRPSLRRLLTPGTANPFGTIERRLFLARRGSEVVGRIGAFFDRRRQVEGGSWVGEFGFFESRRDPEVAAALLGAARGALEQWQAAPAVGPVQLSTNLECGLLVAGDGRPPVTMMPHNPPWYGELFEACGLVRETDLLAYRLDRSQPLDRLRRIAGRALRGGKLSVRPLNPRRYRQEMLAVGELYNRSWAENRGFVPLNAGEKEALLRQFRPMVDPALLNLAYHRGQPVGFSMALPDVSAILKAVDGLPAPVAAVAAVWAHLVRRPRRARLLALGLLPEHRGSGLTALLLCATLEAAWRRGYREMELSWVLEENRNALSYLEAMGATLSRLYRLYRLPF